MSQSQSTRQLGQKDFQLQQQYLMYKQLKEIHRQKQLQQIHQDTKQQNSLSQIYGVTTQTLANQLPSMPSGMANNKPSTCLWSNEMMGHNRKVPPSSQMVIPGIMNCAQHSRIPAMHGLPNVLSHQAIQSANSLPQFLDPSSCGNPASTGRGSLDSRSQFQGLSYGCADAMIYVDRNQAEKASFQFVLSDFSQSEQHGLQACLEHDNLVSSEGFKEKKFFRETPVQSLNSGSGLASIQLTNEDLQGREQADWPGCLQDKLVSQVKPSSDAATLDQRKPRLLSSQDEDVCWDASSKRCDVGAEGYLYGNRLDSNEYSSACPSIQSGSWSALMQEALGASSSDMVVQEDWSDLTFQNAELSSGSHSAILNENGLQGSSSLTSRPFPLCSDADESSNSFPAPIVEQALLENSNELDEGILSDSAHHFFWQQGEQMNNNQLYQSRHQEQYFGSSNQAHIQDTTLSCGTWPGQMCELSGNYANSANMEFDAQNTSDTWAETKKTQFHPVVDQLSERLQRPHGWISNSFGELQLVKSVGGSLEMSIEVPDANQFVPTIISNSSELNWEMDEASDVRHFNCGRHAASDSSNRNSTEYHQHQPNLGQQASDMLLNAPAKDTVVSYDNRQKYAGTDNSSFAGRPSSILLSSSQKSSGQYFGKSLASHRGQHHRMGDFEITHGDALNQRPYLKGSSQSFALGSESQNPGSFDHLHFPGLPNFSNAANMRKGNITDSETTVKQAERMQSTWAVSQHVPTSVAIDRSTATFPQEKRIGQTSQNTPELLHKVDQSREGNGSTHFRSYDHKTPLGSPASAAPNCVVSNMLQNQPSASLNFTPEFIPSSQEKLFSNHSFPLQPSLSTVSGFVSMPVDLEAGSRGQQTPSAIMTGQSASQVHDACQSSLHSTAIASPALPQLSRQQLQQSICDRSYLGVEAHPTNLSLEGHLNYNAHFRQTEDFYDKPLADQSSQALFATMSSRNSSGNLSSQFYSVNKGHPQQITCTPRGSLSQEHSIDHTKLASKPGVAGGLSEMLHGVWATPSDQQCPSRVKLQNISNLVQLQGVLSQSGETNSLIQKMVDYPSSKKGASAPSDTYSTGMQHVIFEERDKCNSLQKIPSSKDVDDNAQQTDSRIISNNVNEQNIVFKLPTKSDHATTSEQNLFASSLQMLGFSSRQMAEKGIDGSLEFGGKDMPSQDVPSCGQQCSKNNTQFLSLRSTLASLGESECHQTNALITPALPGQKIGIFRNGQILVCDGLNSSEQSPKTVARNGFSRRDSNNFNDNNLVKQKGDACQGDRFRQITQSVIPTAMASQSWPVDAGGHLVVPQQKKRKREAPELLPWHKAFTQGSQRLCSMSKTEMDWAKTTNRLMEKVENMVIGDGPLVPAHKRLILTTQLMQQIIMSVPAEIIKANALISYEDVLYYIAKLALGNACSLISSLGNNTSVCSDSRNMNTRQRTFHIEGGEVLVKAMEDFIDKSRKLESDFFQIGKSGFNIRC
ncbi:uncharacterized protein LOC120277289 isoform X2 [Dioscorea cayenensis subsp. rotundata]|uniref:Uncharacterized protein LOC120277289 isoform X2 n=1 Tax=Dioscorea cayennensis subsp. rotundata TaxID=55577 RepID=A0AB40CN37_DIOCR|nr:uncharacterized protein LOC120277289 isoform X2 [Dioscorea cayenensis subsp. rotundata]